MLLTIEFDEIISQGVTIAITGYVIVFLALLLLYFVFSYVSKALQFQIKRRLAREGKLSQTDREDAYLSGEEAAAIAMAIYLYRDLHDDESDVLTIKKISKIYSPWSSKIYNMRNINR